MKLQINDRGSWRHVCSFDRISERDVRDRAARLALVVNERAKLRILADNGAVKSYCQGPDFTWEEQS